MKLLIIILAISCGQISYADNADMLGIRASMKPGMCGDGYQVAMAFHYRITRRIGPHKYELFGRIRPGVELHAILTTNKTEFQGTGIPAGILMKYVKTKEMTLESGFTSKVDYWEEC